MFKKVVDDLIEEESFLKNPSVKELRELAKKDEVANKHNIPVYHTKITSRIKDQTFIYQQVDDKKKKEIKKDIKYAVKFLKENGKELIFVERCVGQNNRFGMNTLLIVPKEYARLAFMNTKNFFDNKRDKGIDIITVVVPGFKKTATYIDIEENVTFILGTDYYGEVKMSMLRLAMKIMRDEKRGLGLHAGSKVYRVIDKNHMLIEKNVLVFGLSGTGKTTIIIHDHEFEQPEGIGIKQDDIILLNRRAFASGTENYLYIKTDNVSEQESLLNACLEEEAIVENVAVKEGELDFDNTEFCANGRAIINRMKISNSTQKIDIKKIDYLFFNTRRYDIPIAGRLKSIDQAVTYYMLGESVKTSASTMDKSQFGKTMRVVGFDPFIVPAFEKNAKRLKEIFGLNPKLKVFILNTGKIGGIEHGIKIKKEDTFDVIKAILKGTIKWKFDKNVGYDIPEEILGVDMKKFDPYMIYGDEKFKEIMDKLRKEREKYLKQFKVDFLRL